MPTAFPGVPKEKMERSFLRAPINYKQSVFVSRCRVVAHVVPFQME